MKICIICQKEYTPVKKANKQKTCGPDCSKINKNNLSNSEIRKTIRKSKREKDCDRLGIPQHLIIEYGVKFLDENPEVLESVKLMWLMNGRSTAQLENPHLDLRNKNNLKAANRRHALTLPDKWAICVQCNCEYNKSEQLRLGRGHNTVTCSITCKENKLKDYHKNYNQTLRKNK